MARGLGNGQLMMDWMGWLDHGQLAMDRLARDGQLGRAWQWRACNGLDGTARQWTGWQWMAIDQWTAHDGLNGTARQWTACDGPCTT